MAPTPRGQARHFAAAAIDGNPTEARAAGTTATHFARRGSILLWLARGAAAVAGPGAAAGRTAGTGPSCFACYRTGLLAELRHTC